MNPPNHDADIDLVGAPDPASHVSVPENASNVDDIAIACSRNRSSEAEDYESTNADNEMLLSDMPLWKQLFESGEDIPDVTKLNKRVAKRPRFAGYQSESDGEDVAEMDLSKIPIFNVDLSKYSDGKEKISPSDCMVLELLTQATSGRRNIDIITLRSAKLCSKCSNCELLNRVRVYPDIEPGEIIPSHTDREIKVQFWKRLDLRANNIYYLASQCSSKSEYPVTQMLNEGAILDHPAMLIQNRMSDIVDRESFEELRGVQLNAIQTEEQRLSKAMMYAASHYRKLARNSKARVKLSAIDVFESLCRSLRVLAETDFNCRKEAEDDALPFH